MRSPLRTVTLTAATMVAFAANSLLCRAALRGGAIGGSVGGSVGGSIDAASFTALRLVSGALVLAVIVGAGRTPLADDELPPAGARPVREAARPDGSWRSALALTSYAAAFSFAYLRLSAGAGALLLFGAVQLTMIAGGLRRGERPSPRQWAGLALAASGLVVINLPSLDPPPAAGAALMLLAGVAWGLYSLRGRGAARPLAVTAGNFARSVPFAIALAALALATTAHITPRGAALAIASGGLASGLGYALWYAVLPSLGAARAAIVQLSVPVIAALGAIVLLAEPLRPSLALGGATVLAGLGLALWPRAAPGNARAA